MELLDLKTRIEKGTIESSMIIFKYTDSRFIPYQYINRISKVRNLPIEFIHDITPFMKKSMFRVTSRSLFVYSCDELKDLPVESDNLIIITKKCDVDDYHVVTVPKLEDWQVKDYLYTRCKGAENKQLDYLFEACNKDIYSVENESDKIKIFEPVSRKYIVDELFNSFQLPRNNTETIFDFTTALLNRDLEKLTIIYQNIDNLDIEPLGVVTILYKNLKNMILVGFQPNPTEANTGLKQNQIWGIKKSLANQNAEKVLKMFHIVSEIDYKLKNGELPAEHILNYTVFKCLSA